MDTVDGVPHGPLLIVWAWAALLLLILALIVGTSAYDVVLKFKRRWWG